MRDEEEIGRFVAWRPRPHRPFFARPHWTRRMFFRLCGGVTASMLAGRTALAGDATAAAQVSPINKAKNVISIPLAGAPSHIETFDFKMGDGVTPSYAPFKFNPNYRAPAAFDDRWSLMHALDDTNTSMSKHRR